MESVPEHEFRDTLARWASGVTVVTARAGGEPVGMTAASFSSLSLDPPLVLVCIAASAQAHDGLVGAPGFAVHVLGAAQAEMSARFAKPGTDKFDDLPGRARALRRAAAALRRRPPGVRAPRRPRRRRPHDPRGPRGLDELAGTDPLLYCNRAYGRLSSSVLRAHRFHLIVQPTAGVSAVAGVPPASTASRAARRCCDVTASSSVLSSIAPWYATRPCAVDHEDLRGALARRRPGGPPGSRRGRRGRGSPARRRARPCASKESPGWLTASLAQIATVATPRGA